MNSIRKLIAVFSLCALTGCGAEPSDCFVPTGGDAAAGLVMLAFSLTCAAVVAASNAGGDDEPAAADAPTQTEAAVSLPVAPADEGPADPVDQYVLALRAEEPDLSRYWLCRSASQRHKLQGGALYQLGDLSLRRYADSVESYKWFALAAQHGNEIAPRRLEALREAMTPEEVQAGEAMAASWQSGNCGDPKHLFPVASTT